MKLKPLSLYLLFCTPALLWLTSCNDIIEPSITNQHVILEAPTNDYQSNSYAINFWWNAVDHALSYHLQVVTPNFKAPGGLVLDTIVPSSRFSYTLSPGDYQWRVMAENGSSSTAYATPNSFTIEASSIKQQSVQLTSPANNSLTNQSSVVFQWGSLYGANAYQVEVDTNNFVNGSTVVLNQTIPGQQISYTFPKDQVYQWRVRAQNDTAQAQWSPVYQITYDHTPPVQVTLTSPTNNTTLSLPVTLQWQAVGTAVKYKLYVYKSDGTTLYSSNFPMQLTGTSYQFNSGSSGDKIYWTITALDAAGNESKAAAPIYFTLQ